MSDLVTPTARVVCTAPEGSDAWFTARRVGITGSDVAAILGMSKYRSPYGVWLDKTGQLPDLPRSPELDEAADWGRELENHVARRFAARTGHDLLDKPGMLAHSQRPWMLANLDKLVVETPGGDGVAAVIYGEDGTPPYAEATAGLECKTRSEYQVREWDEGVPDEPALQAHWYMAVTGYRRFYVAALVGGNKLRWHTLEADDELAAHLVDAAGRFLTEHVRPGVPPSVDGSEATTELLAHLYDVEPESVAVLDPAEVEPLLKERAEAVTDAKTAEYRRAEAENRLKAMAADCEVATAGGEIVFTWRCNGTLATKRLRGDHPDLYRAYLTAPAFDTRRFAADHPDTYAAYRVRRFLIPKEAGAA